MTDSSIRVPPGEQLREIRLARGLSVREFAAVTGLNNGYVSNIECGRQSCPNMSTIPKLARAYGIEPLEMAAMWLDWFAGEDEQ